MIEERLLEWGFEDVVIFKNPDYDTALIAVSTDNCAVYDFELMVAYLMLEDGMEEMEAIEFIEYNTLRAMPYYPNAPIVINMLGD